MATQQPDFTGLSDPRKNYAPVTGVEDAGTGQLSQNRPDMQTVWSLPVIPRPEILHPDKVDKRSLRRN